MKGTATRYSKDAVLARFVASRQKRSGETSPEVVMASVLDAVGLFSTVFVGFFPSVELFVLFQVSIFAVARYLVRTPTIFGWVWLSVIALGLLVLFINTAMIALLWEFAD